MTVVMPLSAHHRDQSGVAAFFDVDNTLLPGEASEIRFFRWLWQQGIVGWPEAGASLAWLMRQMPPWSLHPLRERKVYLSGKSAAVIERLGTEFCHTQLCPRISPAALRKVDEHREAGHTVILLTGSLDFLIGPIAGALRVDQYFAGRLEQINGLYTGHVMPPLPYGYGKRQLLEQVVEELALDLAACYAYGDSPGDLDVFRLVGNPTVVNPIRGMARIARLEKWPVVEWK